MLSAICSPSRIDPVGGTAEVDAGVNPVTKGDVVGQLAQLSVDVQIVSVRARVGVEREAIRAWHDHILSGVGEQGPDLLAAIKEEFEHSDARTCDCAVTRRIAWVSRRTLRECLWQQEAAVASL